MAINDNEQRLLDSFINKVNQATTSRKSVLEPHLESICYLKKNGCTEKIILQYLKEEKGIQVTQQTLNWFIRSRLKDESTPKKAKVVQPATSSVPEEKANGGSAKQFDWQTPTNLSDLI